MFNYPYRQLFGFYIIFFSFCVVILVWMQFVFVCVLPYPSSSYSASVHYCVIFSCEQYIVHPSKISGTDSAMHASIEVVPSYDLKVQEAPEMLCSNHYTEKEKQIMHNVNASKCVMCVNIVDFIMLHKVHLLSII